MQTSQADSEGLPPPADRAKKKALPTPMQLEYVDGQQVDEQEKEGIYVENLANVEAWELDYEEEKQLK